VECGRDIFRKSASGERIVGSRGAIKPKEPAPSVVAPHAERKLTSEWESEVPFPVTLNPRNGRFQYIVSKLSE
jgi:hypothetical protein